MTKRRRLQLAKTKRELQAIRRKRWRKRLERTKRHLRKNQKAQKQAYVEQFEAHRLQIRRKLIKLNPDPPTPHCPELINIINEEAHEHIQIAEVGVFHGSTMCKYLSIIDQHNGQVYAIDWFRGSSTLDYGKDEFTKLSHLENNEQGKLYFRPTEYDKNLFALENIERFRFNIKDISRVKILIGDSSKMMSHIPDGSLDVCFIDADHRYISVIKDIAACLSKVRDGGVICGDDYDDIHLAGGPDSFTLFELDSDYIKGKKHCGVMQAIHDVFGDDFEYRSPKTWYKRLDAFSRRKALSNISKRFSCSL